MVDKNSQNILLVEDNPGDARLTVELLKERGFKKENVDNAASLKETVEKYQPNQRKTRERNFLSQFLRVN